MEIKHIDPVPVVAGDLVGYTCAGFVLLNPVKDARAVKPNLGRLPLCTACVIQNNQAIRFSDGDVGTLHDINGKWYLKPAAPNGGITPLEQDRFFEVIAAD